MKLKAFVALAFASLLCVSCGSAGKMAESNDFSSGNVTGTVLSRFFSEYSKTGSIDFSKAQNILDVASLVSNLSSLRGDVSNQTSKDFSNGLISGSTGLVNGTNVSGVLNALTQLGNFDFSKAMNDMQRGRTSTSGNVDDLKTGIVNVLSLLKK